MIPENLRIADLVAKTARVTLKDTMRVMQAIKAVACLYDTYADDLIELTVYDTDRPEPENVAACEHASFEMRQLSVELDELREALNKIKVLV